MKKHIFFLWNNNNGLVGICENNLDRVRKMIKSAWDNTPNMTYTHKDVIELIDKREYNNWYLEEHPINALYQNGTNL